MIWEKIHIKVRPCPSQLVQLSLRRANSLCSLSAPPEPVYFWVCGGRTPENHFGRRDKKLVQGLSMAFPANQREPQYTICWLLGDYLEITWGLLGVYLGTTWGILGGYLGTTWGLFGYCQCSNSPLFVSFYLLSFLIFWFCHFHQLRFDGFLRVTK